MKIRKRIAASLCASLLMSIGLCQPAQAGSINGNEQAIVSVIYGQFEQNGVVYKVRQEYISSAISYLQQDDVDLGPADAQSVISEIYANVQTGVESGYLEPVGGSAPPPPAGDLSTQAGQGSSGGDAAGQKATASNGNETHSQEAQNENSKNEAGGEAGDKTDENEENGETANAGENGENAEIDGEEGTKETAAEPEPEPPPTPQIISILELVDKAPPQSYTYLSKDTDALMARMTIPYEAVGFILIVFGVILATLAIVSLWKKLLLHHHHRKLRTYLKCILTMEITGLSAVCLLIVGVWIGAFQDSAVLNKLSDTGYYQSIYEDLRRDTSVSFALLDIPDEVMDDAVTYERVVLAARQQVESDLGRGGYEADTAVLTDKLEEDIRAYVEGKSITMTDQAELGLNELMERLGLKYQSLLKWPFAPWWVKFQQEFISFAVWVLPVSLLMMIAGQVLLVFLHHYKHRGLKLCGLSVLTGGGIATVVIAAGYGWLRQQLFHMTPEYMERFFQLYGAGVCRTGAIVGAIGILCGFLYLVIVKTWKEGKR